MIRGMEPRTGMDGVESLAGRPLIFPAYAIGDTRSSGKLGGIRRIVPRTKLPCG
jgi:hypothetical protein